MLRILGLKLHCVIMLCISGALTMKNNREVFKGSYLLYFVLFYFPELLIGPLRTIQN